MGKFDRSRLSGLKDSSSTTASTETTKSDDLRLKLLKKNQILDARQLINQKKQQQQQKKQIVLNKKQIFDNNNNNSSGSAGGESLLIMKTIDEDTGSERRLYKVINNYSELNKKKHIVFANSKNTLITLNNDQNLVNRNRNDNNNGNLFKRTIRNHLVTNEDVDLDDDLDEDDDNDDVADVQIKRTFNNNENFKIKINNKTTTATTTSTSVAANSQIKRVIGSVSLDNKKNKDDAMDVDNDEEDDYVHSPIQGYRLLVSNLHPNVTEDDILELFSAIGPIKRAKLLKKAGTADVVYVKLEDARNAVMNYNNKLLDGRELKIELVTKIPISEKISMSTQSSVSTPSPPVQQVMNFSHQVPAKPVIPAQAALPQRVRPTQTASAIPPTSSDIVSKRFNVNTQPIQQQQQQQEQQKLLNINKPAAVAVAPTVTATASNNNPTSKVTVDTSIIHQALFTNTKTNQNPVTFTVKI